MDQKQIKRLIKFCNNKMIEDEAATLIPNKVRQKKERQKKERARTAVKKAKTAEEEAKTAEEEANQAGSNYYQRVLQDDFKNAIDAINVIYNDSASDEVINRAIDAAMENAINAAYALEQVNNARETLDKANEDEKGKVLDILDMASLNNNAMRVAVDSAAMKILKITDLPDEDEDKDRLNEIIGIVNKNIETAGTMVNIAFFAAEEASKAAEEARKAAAAEGGGRKRRRNNKAQAAKEAPRQQEAAAEADEEAPEEEAAPAADEEAPTAEALKEEAEEPAADEEAVRQQAAEAVEE